MEIRINIECDTISEFYAHLTTIADQVMKAAKAEKLTPLSDEFKPHHANHLYDDNCYGAHEVFIHQDGSTKRSKELFQQFIDPIEHGENGDAETLWNFCFGQGAEV